MLMEGSRCIRSNGRKWRCNRQVLVGHTRCAHHFMQLRLDKIRGAARKRKRNDAEKLMEDSWCVCAKRGWRCSRWALVGHKMCEHHYGRLKQKNVESARTRQQKLQDTTSFFDDSFVMVNMKRKGSDAGKFVEREGKNVDISSYCDDMGEKGPLIVIKKNKMDVHQERSESYETKRVDIYVNSDGPRKATRFSLVFDGAFEKDNVKRKRIKCEMLMDGSRCVRFNGRKWRCSRQALVGHTRCAHHCMQLRLDYIKRAARKRKRSDAEKLMEDSWCVCTKRGWRCSRRALVGHTMCEHHYGRLKQKNINSARDRQQKLQDTTLFCDDAFVKVNMKGKGSDAGKLVEREGKNVDISSYREDTGEKGPLIVKKRNKMDVRKERSESCETKRVDVYINSDGPRKGNGVENQVNGYSALDDQFCKGKERRVHKKTVNDVFEILEKDRADRIMDGLQCARTNGKGWRCRQQALVGRKVCEHHYGLLKQRNIKSARHRHKKLQDTTSFFEDAFVKVNLKRKGSDAGKLVEREGNNVDISSYCEEPREKGPLIVIKRNKMDVHKERSESCDTKWVDVNFNSNGPRNGNGVEKQVNGYSALDDQFGKGKERKVHKNSVNDVFQIMEKDRADRIMDGSQCTRTNGKEWRCRQKALVGHKMCSHHSVQNRNCRHRNVDTSSDSKDEDGKATQLVVADSRCRCEDGRGWRCSQQVLTGYNFCEHHIGKRRLC